MNSWAWATRAAASMSASLAPGRAKAMFSRIVVENRKLSSNTTLTAERSDSSVKLAHVVAVEADRAAGGVVEAGDQERQASSCPSPEAPTRPMRSPGRIVREMSCSVDRPLAVAEA